MADGSVRSSADSRACSEKLFGVVACSSAVKWGGAKTVGERHVNLLADLKNNEQWRIFDGTCPQLPTDEEIFKFKGFVMSGSVSSVHDDELWIRELENFVRKIASNGRTKLVGICFAHQLMAKALGGEVGPKPDGQFVCKNEEIVVGDELSYSPFFQEITESLGRKLTIPQSHGECVTVLPPGARSLAKSKTCDHEIVLFKDNMMGVQSHPNLVPQLVIDKILPSLLSKEKITDCYRQEAVKSFQLPCHNTQLNKALKKFLDS